MIKSMARLGPKLFSPLQIQNRANLVKGFSGYSINETKLLPAGWKMLGYMVLKKL
jgi:hypothetical protein